MSIVVVPKNAPKKRTQYKKRQVVVVAPKPRSYQYRGYGDYKLYKAPRAFRPGKDITKTLGGTVGAYLGNGLHNVIKTLTGFGDYEVEQNSLMPTKIGGDPPIISNTSNNSHIVHHREYIGDVYSSLSFAVTTYPINPGLLSTFPWVSQQADSYEQYKFRGMVFEFKSMSSDSVLSTASSSALGTVIMSTQYNALEAPFADKRTMENYEYANSCKPSVSMLHPIECKQSQNVVSELYVRTGAVTQGDARLYDLGIFSIAVQGMQNAAPNQVIGELWVSYELEFYKPKLLIGGGALLTDHFTGNGTNVFNTTTTFGLVGSLNKRSGSNLGCLLQIPISPPYGANTIVFPSFVTDGEYLITYTVSGTSTGNLSSYTPIGTTVNIDIVSTQVKVFSNNSQSYLQSPPATAVTTSFTVQQLVRVIQTLPGTPAGIEFRLTGGTFPTGFQITDLIITQVVSNIN